MPEVRLVVQFTADSKEIADQAIEQLVANSKVVQQAKGCQQFEVFRSALRPEQWVLLEHWDSQEAKAAHAQAIAGVRPPPTPGVKRVREEYDYQVTASVPTAS